MVRFAGEGGLSSDADVLEIVDPDGAPLAYTQDASGKIRVSLPDSGGGSQPVNWCRADLAVVDGVPTVSINLQSGTDFSVSEDGTQILTASGGWFQAGTYMGPPSGVSWDGAVDTARYLNFAFIHGSNGGPSPSRSLGFDGFLPMLPAGNGPPALTCASLAGFVPPGDPAISNLNVNVSNPAEGDTFPDNLFNGFDNLFVWQVPGASASLA